MNSFLYFGLGMGTQVNGTPVWQTMAIQRSQDRCFQIFSGGYLFRVFILANILNNPYPSH